MPYNANIPQATDTLNDSQGDLLNNFQAIQTLIDVNHYDFASALQGKHMFVSLPIQSALPGTTTTEMALFTQNDGSGNPQMWIQQPNNGAAINFTGFVNTLANGGTTLPSGVILKWGRNTTSGGVQNITFTTAFPNAILTVYGALATTAGASGLATSINIYNYSTTGFSVNTAVNAAYCWLAIGY